MPKGVGCVWLPFLFVKARYCGYVRRVIKARLIYCLEIDENWLGNRVDVVKVSSRSEGNKILYGKESIEYYVIKVI